MAPRTAGSTGLRLPFTEVRVFQADINSPCAAGESGIVALRGPHVGPGYSDTGRNTGTFEQGWLISGDLGHVDAEGRLFITGRAKDVIIRGSHNIDPAIIEDALLQHPDVAECGVVGAPDETRGQIVTAYVVLREGVAASEATAIELQDFVKQQIAPYKYPRSVRFLPALPRTATGKLQRFRLREDSGSEDSGSGA